MASRPTVDVAECTDDDIPTCFRAMSRAFGHNAPFLDAYYPQHDTDAGRARGIQRLLKWKSNPDSLFLKAMLTPVSASAPAPASASPESRRPRAEAEADADAEQRIVGIAVWTYMSVPPSTQLAQLQNVEDLWPDPDDREYVVRLWRTYVEPRGRAVIESNGVGVYVLELLAVHPEYQRQGAGTALTRRGIELADQRGLEAVVEATPAGRQLYRKYGFRVDIEEMEFDVYQQDQGRRKPMLTFMRRDCQKPV